MLCLAEWAGPNCDPYSTAAPLGGSALECLPNYGRAYYGGYSSCGEIPTSMPSRPLVVSYSDGEGDKAGVGVCIFSSLAPRPRAAFATVPDVIRRLWARRAGIGVHHDMFLVEAIGPLLLLCNNPTSSVDLRWFTTLTTLLPSTLCYVAVVPSPAEITWSEPLGRPPPSWLLALR